MITFHKPEWIEQPGDIRLHAVVLPDAGRDTNQGVLPCPFCGSPHLNISNTHTPSFTVECDNCDAQISGGYCGGAPFKSRPAALRAYRRAFKRAVEAWNKRDAAPLQEVIFWRYQGKPSLLETVLVQTSEHEIGAAFVECGKWRWLSGGLIDSEVIYWTPMPDGILTRARKESGK